MLFQRVDDEISTIVVVMAGASWKDDTFATLMKRLLRGGRREIVLDLRACESLDTTDVRAIERARRLVGAERGVFTLAGLQPAAEAAFKDANLLSRFERHNTVEDALWNLARKRNTDAIARLD